MMKIKTINSFEEYVDYTEKYKQVYYFRGQANKNWGIIPSLFRKTGIVRDEYKSVIKEMSESGLDAISSIFKLQHYGSPTRICDLTISPLSALYFSTEDEEQNSEDGIIFIFDKEIAVPSNTYELNILSRALITSDPDLKALVNEEEDTETIISILRKNYIIQYDYQFSYSNHRAMLQGGTALLFGFSVDDGIINRIGDCKLDDLIVEAIIVPSSLKYTIKNRLAEIGFNKEILYHQFENKSFHDDFKVICDDFVLNQRAHFNKINAKYRVDTIHFDREKLAVTINNIYQNLYDTYGYNARIWTYFYYDENDIVETNWICRAEWKESNHCNIVWNTNYYLNRMRYINEQLSQNEIIERYSPLIAEVSLFYNEICRIISRKDYSIYEIVNKIDEFKARVKLCSNVADEIGRGNPNINRFVEAAYSFIKDVERIIDDIIYYNNQGHKEVFIRYWFERIIEDCGKSKSNLNNESKRLGLDKN